MGKQAFQKKIKSLFQTVSPIHNLGIFETSITHFSRIVPLTAGSYQRKDRLKWSVLKAAQKLFEKTCYKVLNVRFVASFVSVFLKAYDARITSFIFVSTTGRSGSESLSRIFNVCSDTCACHEPRPVMHGEAMNLKNRGLPFRMQKKYPSKLASIRLRARGHQFYVETNHMFIKSFVDPVVQAFRDRVTIIHLVRDPVDVAKSLYLLGVIPGTRRGNKWSLDYDAQENLIKLSDYLRGETFSHDFYKCLWYWYEIEARTIYYKKKYPDIKYVEFKTEDLSNIKEVSALLDELGMRYDRERLRKIVARRHNQKKERKKADDIGDAGFRKMNEKFLALLNTVSILHKE